MLTILQTRHWAIEEGFFEKAKSIVLSNLQQKRDPLARMETNTDIKKLALNAAAALPTDAKLQEDRAGGFYFEFQGKNLAYIPIAGGLTKGGDLCSYGMRDYGRMITRAEASENIDGILLDIDSPGGTVDGTRELAGIINATTKPIVTYTDGMLASAAYWLASQTDHITANALNYNTIGSIGTLMVYINQSKFIEDNIGSVEIIRAPQSKDKARINSIEEMPDDERQKLMTELKEITDTFIKAVKAGRKAAGATLGDDIFSGKTFGNQEAQERGLVDKQGSLYSALENLAAMAGDYRKKKKQNNHSSNNNNNNNMNFKAAWSAILAVFGYNAAAVEAEGTPLTEEHMNQLNAKLAELEGDKKSLSDQLSALKADNDTLNAEKQELQEQVNEKDATITELNAKLEEEPAGTATAAGGQHDKGHEYEGNQDDYRTSVDTQLAELKKAANLE